MSNEVEAKRLGQGLMLSDGQHRGQGASVVVMSVEQRQTSEEVRAHRDISFAFLFLEVRAEGDKRCLDLLVGSRHHIIRFGRKDMGERWSGVSGHGGSSRKS